MYKLSPSKAHRYLLCTASLQYDTEFKETPATKRGTLLHKMAELLLKGISTGDLAVENNLDTFELRLINEYVRVVNSESVRLNAPFIVEQKATIKLYGFDINYIMDCCIISNFGEATIIDLKTGRGDVDSENNEQLMLYAFGLLQQYPKIKKINLCIFQKLKLKKTMVTKDQVLDFIFDKEEVFEQIEQNRLTYNPGEKQCLFCEHKDKCVARAEYTLEKIKKEK